MWIKDVDGDFVNLLSLNAIVCRHSGLVEGVSSDSKVAILYNGDNATEYMAELEKELNEFGKLVKVELED